MITLITRIFIKDYNLVEKPKVRVAYAITCGVLGVVFNLTLFVIKLLAGTFSYSIAITADAFNNLSDAGSSIISMIGLKLANQKPDTKHPFGHGRFEYLSGLIISFIIIIMGFELLKSSFDKILNPVEIETSIIVYAILIASVIVKLYMAFYNNRIGKKINSSGMKATAVDSISDCFATLIIIISMIIYELTDIKVDGYFGLLVSIVILLAGYKTAKETISPLLGQSPDQEFVKKIEELVMSYDEVVGIHDLVVHDYGPGRVMVSLHAEIPSDSDLMIIHDVIDNIERRIKEEMKCEAVIHMDPIEINNEVVNDLKDKVLNITKNISEEISIHDFRMVPGKTHTNLIFDVEVPFSFNVKDEELEKQIIEDIKKLDDNYNSIITLDRIAI